MDTTGPRTIFGCLPAPLPAALPAPLDGQTPTPPLCPRVVVEPRTPHSASRIGADPVTDAGLLGLTLIWGLNFTVVKWALDAFSPMAFNALRFPLAAFTLWLVFRARGPLPLPERRDVGTILALGLVGNVVYQLMFIFALDATRAGNTALLVGTTPAWTALLSALLREGTLDRTVIMGIGATLIGTVLVIAGGPDPIAWGSATLRGDLLATGSAIAWSLYTVGSRPLIVRYGSVPVTAWTLWAGTAVLVVLGLPALARTDLLSVPAPAWGAVAFAGVMALGVAYLLWYRGVLRLGSARTAAFVNLVPLVALAAAWAVLGEVPGALQWVGAVVILGGVFLARFGGRLPGRAGGGARGSRSRGSRRR